MSIKICRLQKDPLYIGISPPTMLITRIFTIFYGLDGIILILILFDIIRTLCGWNLSRVAKAAEVHSDA
jgi:hypothetical protein